MPPRRAAPGSSIREPNTASALVPLERRDDLRQVLGGVLPVAVEQDDDVEPVLDRPAVPGLLVAAVAEVAGRAGRS